MSTSAQTPDAGGGEKPHPSWFALAKLAMSADKGQGIYLTGENVETLMASPVVGPMMKAARKWGATAGDPPAVPECLRAAAVLSAPTTKGAGEAPGDPLVAYLERQWSWSKETFGPALRSKGIVQHITKELREIEADPHDLAEWVDVIILAMDGFWRHGGKPADLLPAMQAKQDRNFARTWPDWRTMGEDQAIEHDRSKDAPTPPTDDLAGLSAGAKQGEWHVDMFPYRDMETGEPQPLQCEGICTHDDEGGLAYSIATCGEREAKFVVALVNAFRTGKLIFAPAPEVWRPVADWEQFYEVSDHGNVRSLPRRHTDKSGRAWIRGMAIINATISVNGYPMVSLSAPGRPRWTTTVHRLVASAFIPNPNKLPFVNHKDSDRANNLVSNLEWCTHQENVAHAQAAGRLTGRPRGYVSGKRLFTNDEVRQARELRRDGKSLREIAEHFGVGPTAIQSIISGKTYADVI